MKKNSRLFRGCGCGLLCSLVLVFELICVQVASAQLHGTYTIGGADGTFENFNAAVSALEAHGVAGPVTFKVRPGTYNEQVRIGAFTGSSKQNTVAFEGIVGDSSQVILQHNDEFVVQLDGADGIAFRYLTIRKINKADSGFPYFRVIDIKNSADYITFEHNRLCGGEKGYIIYSFGESDGEYNNYHVYRNNYFLEGTYGISKEGYDYNHEDAAVETQITVEANVFEKQLYSGINLVGQKDVNVRNNKIHHYEDRGYNGISVRYCQDNVKINNNRIKIEQADATAIACWGNIGEINNNQIHLTRGGVGIDVGAYESDKTVHIANNFVVVHSEENEEEEEEEFYQGDIGIFIVYPADTILLLHNSVLIEGTGDNNAALYFEERFWLKNKIVKNNIFANTSGGYAVYTESSSTRTLSDYNCYYTTGTKLMFKDGVEYPTLASWRRFNKGDASSFIANPNFENAPDLHIRFNSALAGKGAAVTSVRYDIDGERRDRSFPDIGADEFSFIPTEPYAIVPIKECVTKNADGTYTASFGYFNPYDVPVTIAVGEQNKLSTLENAGQPTVFEKGRKVGEFHVVFDGSTPLSWTLSNQTVTVDSKQRLCATPIQVVEPLLSCVEPSGDGKFTAYFGYNNPNSKSVAVAMGSSNYFSGEEGNQGQPTIFSPGRNEKAFRVHFDGINLQWNLMGASVIATDEPALACADVAVASTQLFSESTFSQREKTVVYPNPIERELNVKLSTTAKGKAVVRLYSLSGSTLIEQVKQESSTKDMQIDMQIDMQNVPKGVYVLEVQTSKGSEKLLVHKN